jgi:hypothetical protein
MKDLQEATENICRLKGSVLALESFVASLIRVLPADALRPLQAEFEQEAEIGQTALLNAKVSEHVLSTYCADVQRLSARVHQRIG